jgi:hypothetical protein
MNEQNRCVISNICPNDMERVRSNVPMDEFWAAFGYLATWATQAYPRCVIYAVRPDEGELLALYYKEGNDAEGNRPDYALGAVWHPHVDSWIEGGHYSFHS